MPPGVRPAHGVRPKSCSNRLSHIRSHQAHPAQRSAMSTRQEPLNHPKKTQRKGPKRAAFPDPRTTPEIRGSPSRPTTNSSRGPDARGARSRGQLSFSSRSGCRSTRPLNSCLLENAESSDGGRQAFASNRSDFRSDGLSRSAGTGRLGSGKRRQGVQW